MPDGSYPEKNAAKHARAISKIGVPTRAFVSIGLPVVADEVLTQALLKVEFFLRHAQRHFSQQRTFVSPATDDHRLRALEEKVQQLTEAAAQRALWRLGELKGRIRELASAHGIQTNDVVALEHQLDRLHRLMRDAGIECLPAPQVDRNLDATLDLVWFDKRNQATLALTVLPEGESEGRIWVHMFQAAKSEDWFDPADATIVAALRRFARV